MSLIQKNSSVNTDYYFWRSQGGMKKLLSSQEGCFFWLITSLNAPHVFQVQMKTFDPLQFSTREQYQIIVLKNRIQKKILFIAEPDLCFKFFYHSLNNIVMPEISHFAPFLIFFQSIFFCFSRLGTRNISTK